MPASEDDSEHSALDQAICEAAAQGNLISVRELHRSGARLNARDSEPLCSAAAAGHLELVSYLHQHGADIGARNSEPLRRAAAGGHSSVVQYLHEAGAATKLLTAEALHTLKQMQEELKAAPNVYQPSLFWKNMAEINERVLNWSGEAQFKRTLNQNYFNFIPTGADDPRMTRIRRLMRHVERSTLQRCVIEDPDRDPASWMSCYPAYFIFKEPNRATTRDLYCEYLSLMFEYAERRDRSGLLAAIEEPQLGNPIRVHRNGKLVSQDIVNSIRERNSILAALGTEHEPRFTLAELGAGYGRLGYVMLKTTACRYVVFDIAPALYLSQWYLTTLLPERRAFRFRRFERFTEIEHELSRADI